MVALICSNNPNVIDCKEKEEYVKKNVKQRKMYCTMFASIEIYLANKSTVVTTSMIIIVICICINYFYICHWLRRF